MQKENIIFICTDGVRLDRISYLESFKKLTNKGCYFPKVVSYAPYTIASNHALLTGIYGNNNGVDNYYGFYQFKNDECKTLTSYLHDAGYYTIAGVIKDIVIPHDGLDKLIIPPQGSDIISGHRDIIRKCGSLKKDGSNFFAFLQCDYVHNPLVEDVLKKYDDFSKEYFENKVENTKRYDIYISNVEKYLNIILNDIRNENIEDSIIVLFSDHGCSLGERIGEKAYGSFCYDYTIMTYGLFLHERLFPKSINSNLVRTVDFLPTILEILQIPQDKSYMEVDGKSLVNIINGSETESRVGFSETGGLGGPYPSSDAPNVHCIRTDKWKLIFNRTPKKYELYNVVDDPEEINNLYGKIAYKNTQNTLLRILRRNLIKFSN